MFILRNSNIRKIATANEFKQRQEQKKGDARYAECQALGHEEVSSRDPLFADGNATSARHEESETV